MPQKQAKDSLASHGKTILCPSSKARLCSFYKYASLARFSFFIFYLQKNLLASCSSMQASWQVASCPTWPGLAKREASRFPRTLLSGLGLVLFHAVRTIIKPPSSGGDGDLTFARNQGSLVRPITSNQWIAGYPLTTRIVL